MSSKNTLNFSIEIMKEQLSEVAITSWVFDENKLRVHLKKFDSDNDIVFTADSAYLDRLNKKRVPLR